MHAVCLYFTCWCKLIFNVADQKDRNEKAFIPITWRMKAVKTTIHLENALAFSAGLILLFDGEVSPVWTQTRTNQPVSWLEVINLASAFPTIRSVADGNLSPLTVAQPSPNFTGFPVIDLFSDRFTFVNPIKIQRTTSKVAIRNHLSSILHEKRYFRSPYYKPKLGL